MLSVYLYCCLWLIYVPQEGESVSFSCASYDCKSCEEQLLKSYNNILCSVQVCKLVDDYGMVSFSPLDITSEDRCAVYAKVFCKRDCFDAAVGCCNSTTLCGCSIGAVLLQINTAIQYGEDLDVDTKDFGGEE
jgi:hypothetical protein